MRFRRDIRGPEDHPAGRPSCPSPAHCAFFSQDNIEYQTNWVLGAKQAYNITVDYLGIWNERPWGTPAYVKALRASLDAAGFHRYLLQRSIVHL